MADETAQEAPDVWQPKAEPMPDELQARLARLRADSAKADELESDWATLQQQRVDREIQALKVAESKVALASAVAELRRRVQAEHATMIRLGLPVRPKRGPKAAPTQTAAE